MKNVVISTVICIAVLYGVDALYFNGMYSNSLSRAVLDIFQHMR